MNALTIRRILYGIAIGSLAAVFIAPQTRWVATSSIRSVYAQADTLELFRTSHSMPQLPQSLQNEPDVQIVLAVTDSDTHAFPGPSAADRLWYAIQHNPESAAMDAALLRHAATDWKADRESGSHPLSYTDTPSQFKSTRYRAIFDQVAGDGERIDPQNSYFPVMRAVGYYWSGNNAAAVTEWEKAAAKPLWSEYDYNEVSGEWRIQDTRSHPEALSRIADCASTLFPQYAAYRSVARMARATAYDDEHVHHDVASAVVIREATFNVGAHMRAQSSTVIGNLVGAAIAAIATDLDAPDYKKPKSVTNDEEKARHEREFAGYAVRAGRPDLALAVQQERQHEDTARKIFKIALNSNGFAAWMTRLLILWALDFLLGAMPLCLILGIIVSSGTPQLPANDHKGRLTAQRAALWGAIVGVILTLCASLVHGPGRSDSVSSLPAPFPAGTTLLLVVAAIACAAALRSFIRPSSTAQDTRQGQLLTSAVIAAALMSCALCASFSLGQSSVSDIFAGIDNPTSSGPTQDLADVVTVFAVTAPALLLIAWSALWNVFRRSRLEDTLGRVFRASAPILLAVIVIAFSVTVTITGAQEQKTLGRVTQLAKNECQLFAQIARIPWPN